MKRVYHLLASIALLGGAGAASAQSSTQSVTVTVTAVDLIVVAGGDVSISVGVGFTEATRSYSVTTNGTARIISAAITTGANFGSGLTVTTNLVAPTGATSNGAVVLSTGGGILVTGVANVQEAGLGITYRATATASATLGNQGGARVVTYTVAP